MTTFTLAFSGSNVADPAVVSWTTPASGNAIFAEINERSGTGHAPHTISDNNSGVWTKIIGHDQLITDPNARQSASIWWRKVTAGDQTFGTITVTADDGTANSKRLSLFEYLPSAAYDWTFQVQSSADTGTGSTSPQGSGSTSNPGGSDLFSTGFGAFRDDAGGSGGPASIAFTNLDGTVTSFTENNDGRSHASSFTTTGEAAGAKSTSMSWSGANIEAIAAIVVFSNGAIGGGGYVNYGQLMSLGVG